MWLLLLLTLLLPKASFAQDASNSSTQPTVIPTPTTNPVFALFEKYKTDQKYTQDLYQAAFLEYTQKKETHTKYGTLTTLQDKIDATKKALLARNNTLRAYLTALRTDLDKYKSSDPTNTQKYQIELNKLEDWLNEQNSIVSALNNDEDIKNWSTNFNKKYISIQQIVYTSLTIHQINHRLEVLNRIKDLSNSIGKQPDNFIIKSDLVTSSLTTAYTNTQIKQITTRFNDFYPSVKKELSKANGYLQNLLDDLKAVVIKT